MNAEPRRRTHRAGFQAGFTLLEIMVTLALVGGTMVMVLEARERSMTNLFEARNANLARLLARELLSEIAFRELDQRRGGFDGFPGFEYQVEITKEDLVTGKDEDDEDDDPYGTDRNWKERPGSGSDPGSSGTGSGSSNMPGDAFLPTEDEEKAEYPVRRVKLTVFYPNLKVSEDAKPLSLVIETILPPLPEDLEDEFGPNPFSGSAGSKGGSGKSGSGKGSSGKSGQSGR